VVAGVDGWVARLRGAGVVWVDRRGADELALMRATRRLRASSYCKQFGRSQRTQRTTEVSQRGFCLGLSFFEGSWEEGVRSAWVFGGILATLAFRAITEVTENTENTERFLAGLGVLGFGFDLFLGETPLRGRS